MLVLVRHGEATANAAGLLLGRSDVPLTERGRRQVEALRPHVGTVTAVVSSPLRRALDTAAGLGAGCPLVVDDRWVELDYGEHEGQALGSVPADVWQRWRANPDYRPAGGESLADVGRRVRAACEELFCAPGAGARHERGDVVVVSHVSPIKAAVAWALGIADDAAWRLHLSTGSITRIGWGPADGPVLHTYNWLP
jgi:broad specificity phosphatase PhoE